MNRAAAPVSGWWKALDAAAAGFASGDWKVRWDAVKMAASLGWEARDVVRSARGKGWVAAIRDRRPPAVPGSEGCRSVALIEACYDGREALDLPWIEPDRHSGTAVTP